MWQAPDVIAMLLDVTKRGDVEAVARRLEAEQPQGLYALVNNAGTRPIPLSHVETRSGVGGEGIGG